MKRLILLFGALIFMISCNRDELPKGVLGPEEMKSVLKDMHLTDAYLNRIPNTDSLQKVAPAYYELVFRKHHISYKTFETSFRYYSERPVLLDSMYSQIVADWNKKPLDRFRKARFKRFKERNPGTEITKEKNLPE